jgi:hypothetical protein
MRISKVKLEYGEQGRGFGPVELDIRSDLGTDLSEALDEEYCRNPFGAGNPSDDIGMAIDAGFPIVAARMLQGATETPLIDRVFWAHEMNGTATPPQPDGMPHGWDEWAEWHRRNTQECVSCGAYNRTDESWGSCGNCSASLPPAPDPDERNYPAVWEGIIVQVPAETDAHAEFYATCGMTWRLSDGFDVGDCRQDVARFIRDKRAQGYAVTALDPGARWEFTEPEDSAMIPGDSGTLTIETA